MADLRFLWDACEGIDTQCLWTCKRVLYKWWWHIISSPASASLNALYGITAELTLRHW